MKTIFLTMTALAALSAAPAAAQPNGQRSTAAELQVRIDAGVQSGAISRRELSPLRNDLRQLVSLERQYGANGISGREFATLKQNGMALRRQIDVAERNGNGRYDRDDRDHRDDRYGQSGRDDRDRQAGWDDRYDRGDRNGQYARDDRYDRYDRDDRDDRYAQAGRPDRNGRFGEGYGLMAGFDMPNRGDRFAGDARVGQRLSSRMTALPVQYRDEFRDSSQVYYRYDDKRVYRIDRSTNTIMSLLDLPN
ncbi:MAG: hypothetical protein ACXWUP_07220 [Allosphingosinicella sp.]